MCIRDRATTSYQLKGTHLSIFTHLTRKSRLQVRKNRQMCTFELVRCRCQWSPTEPYGALCSPMERYGALWGPSSPLCPSTDFAFRIVSEPFSKTIYCSSISLNFSNKSCLNFFQKVFWFVSNKFFVFFSKKFLIFFKRTNVNFFKKFFWTFSNKFWTFSKKNLELFQKVF